jgi:hypothetical protein
VEILKSFLNGGSLPTDSFLHILQYRIDMFAPFVFLMSSRHGPRRKHRSFSYAHPLLRERVYRAVSYQRPSILAN